MKTYYTTIFMLLFVFLCQQAIGQENELKIVSAQFIHVANVPRQLAHVEGEPIFVQFVLSGMKVDEGMTPKLSLHYSLIDSNGETKKTMQDVFTGSQVLKRDTVATFFCNFGGIGGTDGITHGKYTLKIQVKDENAGVQRDIQLPLEILPKSVFRLKSIGFVASVQQREGRVVLDIALPLFIEGVSINIAAFVDGDTRNRVDAEMTVQIHDDIGRVAARTLSVKGRGTGDQATVWVFSLLLL